MLLYLPFDYLFGFFPSMRFLELKEEAIEGKKAE